MLDILRRVAALALIGAVGVGLLVPVTARSATAEERATLILLRAAEATAQQVDDLGRSTVGSRSASAWLSLALVTRTIGPETLAPTDPGDPPRLEMVATITRRGATIVATPASAVGQINGRATWYCCTRGYRGQAVVALPGALGGHFDPAPPARYVTVCGTRCVLLPVVDYCSCSWGTAAQKVADLSPEAWAAVTDLPLSRGVVSVTIYLGG